MKKLFYLILLFLIITNTFYTNAFALDDTIAALFKETSIEDLMNMTVISASGREQKITEVSNAMTVITREDIERSGARTVEELFVTVPGVHLQKSSANAQAVSIRDQSSLLAKNVLVLIDGVIVFHPAFNGTTWYSLPVVIEEIERIEIIRGPGGVLYSSNAVQGVINIITFNSKEKHNYIEVEGGSQLYVKTTGGFGMSSIKNTPLSFRGFYEFTRNDGYEKMRSIGDVEDVDRQHKFGVNTHYEFSENTKFDLGFKYGEEMLSVPDYFLETSLYEAHNEMLMTNSKFYHKASDLYDFDITAWHRYSVNSFIESHDCKMNSWDIKTQHNLYFGFFGEHVFSAGVEMLINDSNIKETLSRVGESTQRTFSAFIQEEYRPIDKLILNLGLRLDKNTHIIEHDALWQPRISLMYLITEKQNIRAVASRFLRQISFLERDIEHTFIPGVFIYRGNPNIKPEEYWTYELGYRGLFLNDRLSFTADAFLSVVEDKVLQTYNSPILYIDSLGEMRYYGLELDIDYELLENLKVYADYTYTSIKEAIDTSTYATIDIVQGTPKHEIGLGLRHTWNNFKFDFYVKYIDNITNYSVLNGAVTKIPSFFRECARIAYEFDMPNSENIKCEIELVANDIFDGRQLESSKGSRYIGPDIHGGIKFKF